MLGAGMKDTSLAQLSGGGLSGAVEGSKFSGGSYEDGMNKAAPAAAAGGGGGGGGGGYTMEEVAKHTSKSDCWVVVAGQVLNVTNFLSEHPGGELAILTFAGKDATEEFNMIHPPDVIPKYAPDAIIGVVGTGPAGGGGAAKATPAAGGGAAAPLLAKGKAKDWQKADKNRKMRMEGEGRIPGWIGALCYTVLGFMKEILFTIIPQ